MAGHKEASFPTESSKSTSTNKMPLLNGTESQPLNKIPLPKLPHKRRSVTSPMTAPGNKISRTSQSTGEIGSVVLNTKTMLQGNCFGRNARENRHLDRIFNSYKERRGNEFNEFAKCNDARINCRTALIKLKTVNENLNKDQINAVKDMGLLAITKIQFEKLDRQMVYWLLQIYHPIESCLKFDEIWMVNFSEKEVGRALGVRSIGYSMNIDLDSNVGYEKYKKYFKSSSGRIDLDDVGKTLQNCSSSGEEFKVCYLAYLFGTLLFPDSQKNLRIGYLNVAVDLDNLHLMNWAKLIRDTLNGMLLENKKNLSGCVFLFQVMFYAHVVPKGESPSVDLSSQLSYIEQLTKEKVATIKSQFSKLGGYWLPKARYANISIDSVHENDNNSQQNTVFESKQMGDQPCGDTSQHNHNIDELYSSPHENNAAQGYERSTEILNFDGLSSSDDESDESEDDELENERPSKNTVMRESLNMPKNTTELESRVGNVETILYQIRDVLNSNLRQTPIHARETEAINTKLLRQQIKLLKEIKQCLTEHPPSRKKSKSIGTGRQVGNEKQAWEISDDEKEERIEIQPCNPLAGHDDIVLFLFGKKTPNSKIVIDYGKYTLTIDDIDTLRAECYLRDSVLDAVAYMCTLDQRKNTNSAPDWFFPAMMMRYMFDGKTNDEALLKYFFTGDYKLTNNVENLQRVFLPIHDQFDHWFLAVINYYINVVEIFDTCRSNSKEEHRKTVVMNAVNRFDVLMCKLEGNDYRSKVPSFRMRKSVVEFRYEHRQAPVQNNGFDCGLYVSLFMKYDEGVECIESKEKSNTLRQNLAVEMYKHSANKFVWK